MERNEVQSRLCRLTYDVMCEVFSARIPADCWCGKKDAQGAQLSALGMSYQFDAAVIEYIEQAVRADIAARREAREQAAAMVRDEDAWKKICPPVLAAEWSAT